MNERAFLVSSFAAGAGAAGAGSKSRLIRARHRALALHALRGRQLSRAGLAEELDVTRAAAAEIVASLIADGFIEEQGPRGARGRQGGRPSIALALSTDGPVVMGVEIGHDRLRVAVMDLAEAVAASDELAVPEGAMLGGGHFDTVSDLALGHAGALLHAAGLGKRLAGIAVAVPGFTDRHGRLVAAPLLGWGDVPLRQRFQERFRVPVAMANDANLCAFGEAYLPPPDAPGAPGAAEPASTEVLFVLLETGVGGGYLFNGRFLAGADGLGCEIGHIGGRGGEGGRASLEQRFGKPQLLSRAGLRLGAALNAPELIALAAAGEGEARRFAGDEGGALCEVLADLVYLLNPGRVVLGGEMAALFAPVLPDMAARLDALLLPRFPRPDLALARHGAQATALGAAGFAHAQLLGRPDRVAVS